MNKLPGRILLVESSGDLSLVEVDVGGDVMISLVLDTPETSPYLAPGAEVAVLFKESEVILARSGPAASDISLRNRLGCRILGRDAGKLLTHFRLAYRHTVLHALITTRSADAMGLRDGDDIVALVKSTEVSLERDGG